MLKRLLKWNRRRRFILAYRILRNEYKRHKNAGHQVYFRAVNQSDIALNCMGCTDLEPSGRITKP